MKILTELLIITFMALGIGTRSFAQGNIQAENNEFVKLTMELLAAVKNKKDTDGFTSKIAGLSLDELSQSLDSDNETKAFWINIYNAYVQIILSEKPELFQDRDQFFKSDRVNVGAK